MLKTFTSTVYDENATLLLYNVQHTWSVVEWSSSIHYWFRIMLRPSLSVKRLISQSRDPRNNLTFKQAERRWRKLPGWSHVATTSNPSGQLASRQHFDFAFLGAFARLSVLSSPSSSHLNATSDPTNGRSARNAPAHPSGRSSALLLRPFRPRIGCFSSSFFSLPFALSHRVGLAFGFKRSNLLRWG